MKYEFRMKYLFLVACTMLLLLGGCHPSAKKTIDPNLVNFEASYDADFDNVLYPSMMLALANYQGSDIQGLFSVSLTSPKNNSVVRIVVDSTMLNYVSIMQESLPKRGQRYTFTPVIKWKYDNLYRLRTPGLLDLTFTCYVNDEEVDVKTIRLNYRSINECLLSLLGKNGRYRDYRWLFTAFVNEDHPKIDNILSEILDQGIVSVFDGDRTEKKVESQMRAIWYYALHRGITYSTISCTSNKSGRANSQYIRFFDDVYNNRQANCIDACVFFSSLMRRVGLQPIIFVEPCHAFLGYYTDKNRKKIATLETTITGWVNLPELDKHFNTETGLLEEAYYNKIARYLSDKDKEKYQAGKMSLEDIKKSVSNTLFDRATEYQRENYEKNKDLYSDTTQMSYQKLVVSDLRKQISPIQAVEN